MGGTRARKELAGIGGVQAKLKSCSITQPGCDWIIGCLDPVGQTMGRMPGANSVHSVITRFEALHTISWEGGASGQSWDLCVVQGGGDNTILQYLAAPAGTDFSAAMRGTGYGVMQAVDQSMDFLSPFTDSTGVPVDAPIRVPGRSYQASKRTAASVTAYYVGPKLTAGGTVFSTRVPFYPGSGGDLHSEAPGDPAFWYRPQPLQLDERTLVMQGAPPFTADAAVGVYLPQLTSAADLGAVVAVGQGPARPFVNGGVMWPTSATSDVIVSEAPRYINPQTRRIIPWLTGADTSDGVLGDSSVSVVLFRGLPPDAKILLKGVLVVEGVPLPGSPERPFIRKPDPYDYRALALYSELLQQLPNGYPSEDNFLGAVGAFIAKAASSLWGLVRPIAAPVAAQFVHGVADRISEPRAIKGVRKPPTPAVKVEVKKTRRVLPPKKGKLIEIVKKKR